MTDSGGPPRRPLCFLSTLLSQKVPEKSDTVLRCIISGQPKPEVTWYKNGQTIEEGGLVSSYEFFENQYIHLLHLYCCTQNDAAVYQIAAKNCFGMICCSASIEVECSSENTQLVPNPAEDGTTGWNRGPQTSGRKSTNRVDEKEPPSKEEGSLRLGTPTPADSSPSKFNPSLPLQLPASNDMSSSSSETPLHAPETRQLEEACDLNSTEAIADGLLFPNLSNIPDKQDVHCHGTVQSKLSKLTDGAFNNDEDLHCSPQSPRAQKYISVSLPLSEAATSIYPGDRAPVNEQISSRVSSDDSDSDYELCPEITLTYTEEFSDDDLEYLECSDVMTDYTNAVWQRNLEGTERVFLLESDDEEMEFSKYGLGEREPLPSEMGRGPRVSDDTGPMEARAGFSGDHSQSQEVTVRRRRASTHGPPCPQTGMTLTLGSHQDGTSAVTNQGRYKRPTASAENDYPGIQGETRDSHPAGEEFAGDKPLTVDKAVAEGEVKRLSGEFETSGMNPCLEMVAEERLGETGPWSTGCSEKPGRVRRPGMKGKPKKLKPNLKDSALDGALHRPHPPEPAEHPLTQGERKESSGAAAEAPGLNSQFCPEGTILTHAEQEAKMLQTPPGALPPRGGSDLEGEGVQVHNLFETSRAPDQSARPQVRIQDAAGETLSPSRTPAFSEPAQEGSALPGTTAGSVPNLGRINDESASLIPYLDRESCPQGPPREENQGREDDTPGRSREDPGQGPGLPEATHATPSPCELSVCLPTGGSGDPREPETLSVASPAPTNIVPTPGTVCHGPRGREAECLMEHLKAGDQGTGGTMDPPAGAPVHKHLPQEFCSMDLQLAEGQSKVSDLCFPDERTPEVVFQTRGSGPAQSPGQSNKDGNTVALPAPSSAHPWDTLRKASGGATGEPLARVENSTPTRAPTGQGRLSPSTAGGLQGGAPLSSENSSVQREEGEDSPRPHAPGPTDTSTSHSSIVEFPQEPATLPANTECLQGARERGDAPTGTTATKVHPAKYLPISIAENSCADGPEESSHRTPGESVFQHPSNVQSGRILNGPAPESAEELCTAPRGPGVHVCAPLLPEGELGHSSPLQVHNQPGGGSQTVDGAANRSLEEKFQEEGRETLQRTWQESLPHQGSLSEDHVQESQAPTPAAGAEMGPAPLDHPSASCREERRPCSGPGTSVAVVAEAAVADDRQTVSSVPPLSNTPLEESTGSGPGHGEAGCKPKGMALGASVSEVWPPGHPADSESKEPAAGATTPDGAWAVADTRQAGAARPVPDPSEPAASAGGPQAELGSALADNREIHEGQKPARRNYWRCLSARYLSQRRLLESSVDPVDKESCVTDLPAEASTTRGQETVNNVSQNQEETQLVVALPAFFKSLLSSPKILESSVDPIDETGVVERARVEPREPSEPTLGLTTEDSKLEGGHLGQRAEVGPASSPVPCPQRSGGTIPGTYQNQEASERGEAEQSKNSGADFVFPALPLSSGLAVMTQASAGVDIQNTAGQVHGTPQNCSVEPSNCECTLSASEERGERGGEGGTQPPSPGGLILLPSPSSPEENITNSPISHKIEEPEKETPRSGETKTASPSSSPAMTAAFTSGERESETAPETLRDPCQLGPALGRGSKSGAERPRPTAAPTGGPPATAEEEGKRKQETTGSGRLAEGMKKKILSKVAALRLRLEERENVRKNSSSPKKVPRLEKSVLCTREQKDPKEPPCQREGKAPVLLKKIQAEMFPEHSGNVRLSCQFAEIHEDSAIRWTKDSKPIAEVQRSAGDNSTVSLAIAQAGQKDQGLYGCCIQNSYGKVTAEFNLTPEVLRQLSSHQDIKGCEEIEFSQLIFKEDFLRDRYFGDRLRGQIATEELHFGEGVHRKAFRSRVMRGLTPVFQPGHACVLKVHNAVAYGTRNDDELVQRNYTLAAQECYVQNTARCYAKIYAAEAQPLEGFGEVPEIIPIFLIHRPENNIPYATVEEELMGEFVKYSIRDGKEINFLRRDSEAGQKCCTFQHWVYQKTGGCLLVTDMQGVGMKLTDVGIATLAKGYKGFKGNCSMTFIDQFKALHQCNKYCKMLGLTSLQNNNQKQKKPSATKSKSQPNSTTVRKTASGVPAEKKT